MLIFCKDLKQKLITDKISFIEISSNSRNRCSVYKFWYQIYHQEMKRIISDLNHSEKIICDDLEPESVIYTMQINGKIIASVRLTESEKMSHSKYKKMIHPVIKNSYVFLTKLMITKEFQNLYLSKKLLSEAEIFTKSKNKKLLVLDCNDYMIPFFKKAGFILASNNSVHSPHYGEVYIMKKEI